MTLTWHDRADVAAQMKNTVSKQTIYSISAIANKRSAMLINLWIVLQVSIMGKLMECLSLTFECHTVPRSQKLIQNPGARLETFEWGDQTGFKEGGHIC